MKTLRIACMVLFAILLSINLSSCSDDDNDPTLTPDFRLSSESATLIKSPILFDATGGERTLTFATNVDWAARVTYDDAADGQWCTFTPVSGQVGNGSMKITVAQNELFVKRTANVKIIFEVASTHKFLYKVELSFTQSDAELIPAFTLSDESASLIQDVINIKQEGEERDITFNTNLDWTAIVTYDDATASQWCTLTPILGPAGDNTMKLTVSENTPYELRSAKITVVFESASPQASLYTMVLNITQSDIRIITIDQAGDLPTLISDNEKYSIKKLKLIGDFNGTDAKLIRDIALNGTITNIDLEETNVVAGGDSYYDDYGTPLYSSNNVMPKYLFMYCTNLQEIKMPGSITSIGDWVFYKCASITSIKIPDGVTNIEEASFAFCLALTSIIIPDGVTYIGRLSFDKCSSLTSIIIPEGVTNIQAMTFYSCTNLASVTLPASLLEIEYSAFTNTGIKDLYMKGSKPPVLNHSLNIDYSNITLHVPRNSKTAYENANRWNLFINIVEE